jgi:VIT1/CCC1 family predicted Fe2+/Mn2+ transporter
MPSGFPSFRFEPLLHRDLQRLRTPPPADHGDVHLDGSEARHAEEVASKAHRPLDPGLSSGGAKGDRCQVAAIAPADISEQAESVHSSMEVWMATGATFMTKFVVASSFLVPVLLLELEDAVWLSVAWGLASVAALSWYIARRQMTSRTVVMAERVGVAVLVVIVSALVGRWVSMTFA